MLNQTLRLLFVLILNQAFDTIKLNLVLPSLFIINLNIVHLVGWLKLVKQISQKQSMN